MTPALWLALIATFSLAVVSPGPDFLAVLRQSIQRGRAAGVATGCGIAAGTIVWIVCTMVGIVGLVRASETASLVVRLVGALFLFGYGVRILAGLWVSRHSAPKTWDLPSGSSSAAPAPRVWPAFRLGFLTNTVGNPKAVVFFTSLFASMLPAQISLLEQIILTVVLVSIATAWFTVVSFLATLPAALSWVRRMARPVDLVLGAAFCLLGALLIPWGTVF
ncbi:MAG: LysE family transporter [Bowdeniella nasicola]|nr:LysE family transporter [Bowdeniella nasicola]